MGIPIECPHPSHAQTARALFSSFAIISSCSSVAASATSTHLKACLTRKPRTWSATRALEEHAEYTAQLAGQVERTSASLAREYQAISRSSQQKAEAMRKLIMEEPMPSKSIGARSK